MTDVESKLQLRKTTLISEAEQLQAEKNQLVEQNKVINRRVSDIVARELQINGAYREVIDLLWEKPEVAEPAVEVKEATPKKK